MNKFPMKLWIILADLRLLARVTRFILRLRVALLILAVVATSLPVTSARAETSSLADGLFRTYAVLGNPKHVAVEAPGRIWFTAPSIDAVGVLTVVEINDRIVEYRTRYFFTVAGSKPYDLVVHNGVVWFTLSGTSELGRLLIATEELTHYPLALNSVPHGLALRENDATLWYAAQGGNALGRFDTATSLLTEFPYPKPNAGLEDIAFGAGNEVWVTATQGNEVRQFDAVAETFQLAVPTGVGGAPISIAVDVFNFPWVTFAETGDISRYAPGTLALWRRFAAPLSAGQPAGIHIQGDSFSQRIWYTLSAAGAVGYFHTRNSGQLLTPHINFRLPGLNSAPWGITVDADGAAWIADSGANQLVEWLPPYFEPLYLPVIARQE